MTSILLTAAFLSLGLASKPANDFAFRLEYAACTTEVIDTFRLGFANRTLGLRLPEKNRLAGADIRGRLQRIGFYRENGREHFNGSVVIPVSLIVTPEPRALGSRAHERAKCAVRGR